MGLLDDAIREHLDLKRRHGADPAEVERAEREALGPVKRNREAPTADDVDELDEVGDVHEEAGHASFAYDQAADDPWTYEHESDLDDAGFDEAEFPARGGRSRIDDDTLARPPLSDRTAAGSETGEHDVEEAMAAHEESEDMLEETPEFLQDTPDHDRLWFEQRPPKDFDFDS
ncbi:MAG: hypothetical protein JOZ07_18670 [Solirubrobacterales bacterium]|nr:hypothetical protein [Solirubrobacterales bacterium]